MSIFKDGTDDYQRLDFTLIRNGAITLYYRNDFLSEDLAWLESHGYRLNRFDCSAWETEQQMHNAFAQVLEFPGYYGRNLNALNDCLSDIEVPDNGGLVLVLQHYGAFAARLPELAWKVLDIIERNSRTYLLFGRHLLALVQSDDPAISFAPVGACAVDWNRREWLNKSRGL
jgi:RNAse (barnase) inhibitor barstar